MRRIFVLRNNDLGDVIVVTPLFEALRRRFPEARIVAGVGDWARPILEGNPYVDETLRVDAPWFNKFTTPGWRARRRFWLGDQLSAIRDQKFDLGIDVLGSSWGSRLLLAASIPRRLGRIGFASRGTGFTDSFPHRVDESVGRNALRFASLLGQDELPSARPQIYLTESERQTAHRLWAEAFATSGPRLVVAAGAGLAVKAWPAERFVELVRLMGQIPDARIAVVGAPSDAALAQRVAGSNSRARWLPEAAGLRSTFALLASSDGVVCNSSMVLHAAAAFSKPVVTVLGSTFSSAREHQVLWGHEGTVSLGREADSSRGIATVEEAMNSLRSLMTPARA